jgi:hypothetical protein
VLSKPQIADQLSREFVAVQLYTDGVPAGVRQVPDAQGARDFRDEKLHNYALPYYVVLKPIGPNKLLKVAVYEKPTIGSVHEFSDFLQKALAASKKG